VEESKKGEKERGKERKKWVDEGRAIAMDIVRCKKSRNKCDKRGRRGKSRESKDRRYGRCPKVGYYKKMTKKFPGHHYVRNMVPPLLGL